MTFVRFVLSLSFLLQLASLSYQTSGNKLNPKECQFDADAKPNSKRGPAYTPDETKRLINSLLGVKNVWCCPAADIYKSYGAAVSTADLSKPVVPEDCEDPKACKTMKVSNLQTASCSELLQIRDEIATGGYTAICRHELTNWAMKPAEITGCGSDGSCCSSDKSHFVQRQLSPSGIRRAAVFGKSLKDAGIVIDGLYSSCYERCVRSAREVGRWYNISKIKVKTGVMSNGGASQEFEKIYNYTSLPGKAGSDAKTITRLAFRQWLQKDWPGKTLTGNRLANTHGYVLNAATGYYFDEGDCGWMKPTNNTYGLEGPLDVKVSNGTIRNMMNEGTRRVGMLAVLSPEQTQKMAQCTKLRENLKGMQTTQTLGILKADTNHDLVITEKEFESYCKDIANCKNSKKFWNFMLSVQPKPYWKADQYKSTSNTETSVFHIGHHAYWNGGWVEQGISKGGWAFPWRKTTLDTIRPDPSKMAQILAPLNYTINNVKVKHLQKLMTCEPDTSILKAFKGCQDHLLNYDPIPTRDNPADPVANTQDGPAAGNKYPYPTTVDIPVIENHMMKVAMCLVHHRQVSAEDMAKMLKCKIEDCQGLPKRFTSKTRNNKKRKNKETK